MASKAKKELPGSFRGAPALNHTNLELDSSTAPQGRVKNSCAELKKRASPETVGMPKVQTTQPRGRGESYHAPSSNASCPPRRTDLDFQEPRERV